MSSEFGKMIKISIFGQSHSEAIGAVIDGIPAGERIDMERVEKFMQRRAPGRNAWSTARREADKPEVISGIVNGVTSGAPVSVIIKNTDAHSADYDKLVSVPRPSHSDYPAMIKYGEAHDIRGGGHFSGRLTAPLCFAGAVCIQILERRGISVGAHIASIGTVNDERFDAVNVSRQELAAIMCREFPTISDTAAEKMREQIASAHAEGDSIGGIVECAVLGVPAGTGEPIFDGIENRISAAIFGIPAVKGVEFGSGFAGSAMRGSQNNDAFYYDGDTVKTVTNNSGGILGGMSTGMPIIFRAAFKPTPSIAIKQNTVDLKRKENTELIIGGRHDPCIVPRAVACVEAVAAITILDLLYEDKNHED